MILLATQVNLTRIMTLTLRCLHQNQALAQIPGNRWTRRALLQQLPRENLFFQPLSKLLKVNYLTLLLSWFYGQAWIYLKPFQLKTHTSSLMVISKTTTSSPVVHIWIDHQRVRQKGNLYLNERQYVGAMSRNCLQACLAVLCWLQPQAMHQV